MRRFVFVSGLVVGLSAAPFSTAFAQDVSALERTSTAAPIVAPPSAPEAAAQGGFVPRSTGSSLPRFGIGVKVGTLGIGVDVATALASWINLRAGFNAFTYDTNFNKDGTSYNASLKLRSVDAKLDVLLLGGFRVSPGLLLYNDNNISASAAVPRGNSFTLGGVTYYSDASSPVGGTAALTLNKVSPTFAIGFGNMLPRSSRHFSVTMDLGVVFEGSPQFALGLTGVACTPTPSTNCTSVNNAVIQANVANEQTKVSNDLKAFKYYPEVAIGFGWKF
jgi:hypothetical protein